MTRQNDLWRMTEDKMTYDEWQKTKWPKVNDETKWLKMNDRRQNDLRRMTEDKMT